MSNAPENESESRAPRAVLFALVTGSLAVLALEIAQVRIFSYSIDPLLVFCAISVALLGLGAGAMLVAIRPALARGAIQSRLAGCLSAFAASTVVAHVVFARISHRIAFGTPSGVLGAALPVLALMLVPYLFGGAFISIALTRYVRDIGRGYLANMVGSAVGCVAIYPMLRPFGVEFVVAGVAALAAVSALPLVTGAPRARRAVVLAIALCSIALIPFARRLFPFQPDPGDLYGMAREALRREYPGRAASAYEPVREFARWDSVSKVEVYAFPGEFGRVNGTVPMRLFAQDGGAGSLLVDLRSSDEVRRGFFEGSIWGGAYFLRPHPASVLAIGLGGAPDVLAALHHRVAHVTGVEVNETAIDLVRNEYAPFLGAPYARAGVEIFHRDGRSFVERSQHDYDLIQLSGADTYSAGAAGAFMFSESYLYTREAFERYMRALSPDGVLSITRFGPEALRVITSEFAAMRTLGIDHPESHLVVLGQGIAVNVLFSRRALTAEEGLRVTRAVLVAARQTVRIRIPVYEAMGFGIADPVAVLYAPGVPMPTQQTALIGALTAGRTDELTARLGLDLTPVSDDRPFFFQFLDLRHPGAIFAAGEGNYFARGIRAHLTFLGAIALIAASLMLVPLAMLRRRGLGAIPAAASALYFGALGTAYLFVELTLIQQSALFLGHPTYSVATTLVTLLLASGLGSVLASRRAMAPRVTIRIAVSAVVMLLLIERAVLHSMFVALLHWPLPARVAVLAAVTAPLGFVMGMPFPLGLGIVSKRGETLVAWGLGVNSFASVIASLIAVPLAMLGGFSTVTLIAAGLYALAAVTVPSESGSAR